MGLGTAAFAAPFGSLVEPQEIKSGAHKEMYLIDKIAAGRPVSVCVDGRLDKYSLSKEQIDSALNSWFNHARQAISKAKRQREFQDLLPVLSKGATIRLQNCANSADFNRSFARELAQGSLSVGYAYASSSEDLRIILVGPGDIEDERSYFSEGSVGSVPYIVWNVEDKRGTDGLDVLRHELGHALSLSDQYAESRLNSVPEYGTSDIRSSMMTGGKFSCDDVDGLIFALDCIAQKNTSRGGVAGWRSFCRQRAGRSYAYCKTKNREDLLWVSKDTVRYARYDRQGNLTAHKEWELLNDSRLFSLYPQGIPAASSELKTVYKGRYVLYKTDGRADYLFSTRPEADADEFSLRSGQTLIVRADPHYSVALIQDKEGLRIPLAGEEVSFSKYKDKTIAAETNTTVAKRGMTVQFFYTPKARFEYYRQDDKMLIFMFPKDSAKFYLFFDGKRGDVPSFAGSAAALPEAEAYPVLDSRPVAREAEGLIRSSNPLYLIYHDPDRPKNHRGDYCVTDKTLPANFMAVDQLGRDAWDLHGKYRRFFEGTVQNWLPGSIAAGFAVSPEEEAERNARKKLRQSMSSGRPGRK